MSASVVSPIAELNTADSIVERNEDGLVVLAPAHGRPSRRILYINSYGGAAVWDQIKRRLLPPHHLWGCIELVRRGYEVALAEPLPDFYLHRNPLPHDFRLLRTATEWLGPEGILYCAHNVLYWLPFLRLLGALRCPIVSLLYAREPLDFARAHAGIIALNPAAADHARKVAPKAKVAHLAWGVDLAVFPTLPYQPESFLSCGITQRDHHTLCLAARLCDRSIRVICPHRPADLMWPANTQVIVGGSLAGSSQSNISYDELLYYYYARSAGSLVILNYDPRECTAVGFTNLLEAMAMARPVIVTRTGAVPSEIDVEKVGCGLHVPARDPTSLAIAIDTLASDPRRAEAMGATGRALCETHYNINRFACQLDEFFQTL